MGPYVWAVNAIINSNGEQVNGPESQQLAFTVSAPGTPMLTSPSGTITTPTPAFQWSAVPGATGYELTVRDTTANTTVLNALRVTGTSYTLVAP